MANCDLATGVVIVMSFYLLSLPDSALIGFH